MEANKTTEIPEATKDAKEPPSLKDPSTEDLQEATAHETPLQLSSSQKYLQPLEARFETSTSLNPGTKGSEDLRDPSVSKTSLKLDTTELPSTPPPQMSPNSVTFLEKAITRIPLENFAYEDPISEVQEEPPELSPTGRITESYHELTSDKVLQTQVPESEHFPKHFFSDPSTQAQDVPKEDTSVKEWEAMEDELTVGTSKVAAAQPELHARKKKEKRAGGPPFPGNASHPAVPSKRADLVEVAKEMHRMQFDDQVNNLFQWEKNSALKAIQTGIYIGWRCPHYLWDCFRIGDESKCFCGHLLREHQIISDLSVPCSVSQCRCLMFCFIPSRPEEVGEFWLKKRATFDPKAWRAQCRCKHTHEEHAATGAHPCRHRGCYCNSFESNFLCAACDRRWEEHETFFETEETKRRGKRPYGTNTVRNWHRPF